MTAKLWWRILWLLWLVLPIAAAIAPPATFAYDAQRQAIIAYDGPGAASSSVGHDAAHVSAKHEKQKGTTTELQSVLINFSKFLAAESTVAAEAGAGPGAALGNSSEFFSRVPKANTTTIVASPDGLIDIGSTLERIAAGEKLPYRNDGSIFSNREGLLPAQPQGYYREYVLPTPRVNGPGAQRIIIGQGGEAYYTPDHYKTFIPLNH